MSVALKSKIEAGVDDCLQQCRESTSPWKTASKFIDDLKKSPDWTDGEILELQTLSDSRAAERASPSVACYFWMMVVSPRLGFMPRAGAFHAPRVRRVTVIF